jgi:hypothetical protein
MFTVLTLLVAAGGDEQAIRPKSPPPLVVPVPIPNGPDYRYRLYTDWMPLTDSRRPWRTGRRLEKPGRWEEALVGRPGGRIRELVAEIDDHRAFATTGRRTDGNGGVGEGFEWSAFVGDCSTAGFDLEFTATGPRIVIAVAYYPCDGVTHRYGWSVLAGQFVHGIGWHLDDEDMRALYRWPQFWAVVQLARFCRHYGFGP